VTDRHPNQRALSSLPRELRRTTVPPAVRAWVHRATGLSVVRVKRLAGASSTAVHRLELSDGSRLVLRRYSWPGFLADEPVAPRREVDALGFAFARGLSVPEVVAADATGSSIGDDVPAVLMSFVPGRAVAVPDLRRLAEVAASIHDTSPDGFEHEYFRWYEGTTTGPPSGTSRPKLWETAIELWTERMPAYRPAFIHRDYHPGNVLWLRGEPTGVVDWANACRGPRGCDIAHCRSNLVQLAGQEAADRFVREYESITGETHHPYWAIASILEHGPSRWTPAELSVWEPDLARAVSAMRGA
jgi:Ser/Thr protein kinase RdoA (MazF antagonist)